MHDVPADLTAALVADRNTRAVWEDLTPLARNEWICWVEDAKKAETRRQRIGRVRTDLIAGKRRPCCWPGCPHRKKGRRGMSPAPAGPDVLRPIESLLRKCEKSQQKLAPDTWAHRMLGDNIQALRLAAALMKTEPDRGQAVSPEAREKARRALAAMIRRAEAARAKLAPGTSPHTLQQNRIRALRKAAARVRMEADIRH